MDLKGFIYYKWLSICDLLKKHVPFKNKYYIPNHISNDMRFDSISPSCYKPGMDYVRCRTLELLALELQRKKIQGSIAELGVYRGDFSAIMNHLFPSSKHYLFDTFEGFPKDDCKYDVEHGYTRKEVLSGCKDTSIDIVLSKMEHPENCIIKKGCFPDSLDGLEDTFSFVSLDCDLYKPILAGIEYFYPRLVCGGYIMIHDYNQEGIDWKGCKEAVYDYEKSHGYIPIIPIPDYDGTLILTKTS